MSRTSVYRLKPRSPCRVLKETAMNMSNTDALPAETDVLVVGYGPVGAALASLLGRYGIESLVVDKVQDIVFMPRAIALDNEALRILQMVGLGDEAFERIVIPKVNMRCPYVGNFGQVNTRGCIDGHPKLVTFYQPDLEKALRRQTAQFACVSFRAHCELVDLEQTENHVFAAIRDAVGNTHKIKARYVVGADGASSVVRSLIGQDFQGQTYAEDWLIVDAGLREGRAIDHVEFICDPSRPTPHMPAPGGRERWEFMLRQGESREEIEHPDKVEELLVPWIGPDELVIERKAVYRFHARCCNRFQKDRVFLVGDAAHITPPFVGQGLVAGLRDAANLGWKLAWVLAGKATPDLLKSYDVERRPHAIQMINLARFMGKLVMPRNWVSAVVIHGAMRIAHLLPPLRKHFEELEIKPANRFSMGFFLPAGSKSPLRSGGQLPQHWVRSGMGICLSDDVLGDHLTLVGFGVDPKRHVDPETLEKWRSLGGECLQVGARGERNKAEESFAEDLSGTFITPATWGWIAVVRPDRVIMHAGLAEETSRILSECIQMMVKNDLVDRRSKDKHLWDIRNVIFPR